MIYSREVIPTSLEHALLASRVVAALERMQTNKQDEQVPVAALDEAIRFFEIVLEARNKVKGRELASGSCEGALAYGETIRAIGVIPEFQTQATEVVQAVKQLIEIAKKLRQKRPAPDGSIAELANFFKLVRDMGLQSDKRKIETISALA